MEYIEWNQIMNSPKQKIMITLPEEVLSKLDTHAKRLHYTRSGAIGEAVMIWLQMEDALEKEEVK